MSYRQLAYLPDRRSTRINHSELITLRGANARRAPFEEEVCTLVVSCHGCSYESRNDVITGQTVTLEVMGREGRRTIQGRVRSVKSLARGSELFVVAVELERPENVWDVAFPPEDWLPRREANAVAPSGSGHELRIVPRCEPQSEAPPPPTGEPSVSRYSPDRKTLPPLLFHLLQGLREQIEEQASAAVKIAMAREKRRMLGELRAQLQEELKALLIRGVTTTR